MSTFDPNVFDSGIFDADTVAASSFQKDAFQNNAFETGAAGEYSFAASATILRAVEGSFSVAAFFSLPPAAFGVDAVVLASPSDSFDVEAEVYPKHFRADADIRSLPARSTQVTRRTVATATDPVARSTQVTRRTVVTTTDSPARSTQVSRRVVATTVPAARSTQVTRRVVIEVPKGYGTVDAVLAKTLESSFALAAEIAEANSHRFQIDAATFATAEHSFSASALVSIPVGSTTSVSALFLRRNIPGSFTIDTAWGRVFHINAFIRTQFLVGAWIGDKPVIALLTQLPVEVVHLPTSQRFRLTQLPVEIILSEDEWWTRGGDFAADAWFYRPVSGVTGDFAVDATVGTKPTVARVTQLPVEVVLGPEPGFRLTQLPVEVILSNEEWWTGAGSFSLSAWFFRYQQTIPGLFTANATITTTDQPSVARLTQLPVEAVILPTNQVARVTQLPVEIVLSPWPSFVLLAIKLGPAGAWSGTLDAEIWPRHFWARAVTGLTNERAFNADAEIARGLEVAAFIAPWFRTFAVVRSSVEAQATLDAWKIYRIYGDFAVNAKVGPHFRADAVIKRPGQRFLIRTDAVISGATRTGSITADAHFIRPWGSLAADATIRSSSTGSVLVGAVVVGTTGTRERSYSADAVVEWSVETADDCLWVESWIDAERTVVYEGEGETSVVETLVTARLEFPGEPNPADGTGFLGRNDANNVHGPFRPVPATPVTVSISGVPAWPGSTLPVPIGIHSTSVQFHEWISEPGDSTFWPQDDADHYVWASKNGPPYDPEMTGAGVVRYYREDTVVASLPAPTLDAWLVGTDGPPFSLDAEIVGREKTGRLALMAELSKAGERRSLLTLDADILGRRSHRFSLGASLLDKSFGVDAVVRQPSGTIDAYIGPWFAVNAVIERTMASGSGSVWMYAIEAMIGGSTRPGSFTVNASWARGFEVAAAIRWRGFTVGAVIPGGSMTADGVVLATMAATMPVAAEVAGIVTRRWRVPVEASIDGNPFGFPVAASVAPWFRLDAFIQPRFTLSAFIRGSAYIIFPEGGGDPTDPFGNEPMIGRSFRVKVEAGIAPDVGVGNDAEIERLITLILEAERELEAMYCAWTHYKPQDATAPSTRPYNSNPSGTGYNRGTLPGALNQVVYPGAGDVDDCWVVATVWAALAAGETFKPTVPYFRAKARNPDRPGPTGGTGYQVWLGARGCWPSHKIKKYTSTSWDGFISLLKAGWTASLAVRSSGLPSTYRYGFNGLHQVGVAYQDGKYWLMNPLQPNGSRPREISGLALRTAARGFSGGTISATLFA